LLVVLCISISCVSAFLVYQHFFHSFAMFTVRMLLPYDMKERCYFLLVAMVTVNG